MEHYLPVPDFSEYKLSHSFKQRNKLNITAPRKPQPTNRYILNRSLNASTAHAISFVDTMNDSDDLLSSVYNKDAELSYFDQCFDVVTKIGEGSFGEVFKVRSKENGILYAVKKSKQIFRSEEYRKKQLEEVRRYEEFSSHDHCVTLYRAWEQDNHLYMQMELCQNSLDDLASKIGALAEPKVWSILLDLLLALKALHDKNLIHLDIKLENILISDDNECKLSDFGLVIDLKKNDLRHVTEGDSRYMAPEVLQGEFSKAADIFSLGIAILELSTYLKLEPNGPLWQELRNGMLPENFIQLISIELQEVIRHMMSPNPNQRPTVNQLLHHPRLKSIQKRRQRFAFIKTICKKIKYTYRRIIGYFQCYLCNIDVSNYRPFKWLSKFKKMEPNAVKKNFNVQQSPFPKKINSVINRNFTPKNKFLMSTPEAVMKNSTPFACQNSASKLKRVSFGENQGKDEELASSFDFSPISNNHSSLGGSLRATLHRKKLFDNESSDEDL